MMSYGSEFFFGGSDNVLEWDKTQCIFKFEKKVFLNDPIVYFELQIHIIQQIVKCYDVFRLVHTVNCENTQSNQTYKK